MNEPEFVRSHFSAEPDIYSFFKISPDGKRAALIVGATPKGHIRIWDAVRQTMTHLTLDEGADHAFPIWTPDGERIVYASSRENIEFSAPPMVAGWARVVLS